MTEEHRTFLLEDQQAFATYSGDFNPMHVDPIYARRLAFGAPVVHGAHLALWALETLVPEPQRIAQLRARFNHPIRIGEAVGLRLRATSVEKDEIQIISQGRVASVVTIEYSQDRVWRGATSHRIASGDKAKTLDLLALPAARGEMVRGVNEVSGKALFPKMSALAPRLAQTIAEASRLVGMECPGLNSVFSELTLYAANAPDLAEDAWTWRVTSFDDRFSRLQIEARSAEAKLDLVAFARPSAQAQVSSTQLGATVAAGAYVGRRALVVGGSRGLGELCAKLLALGGADVSITYHVGQAEADAVVAEIVEAGGLARAIALDVLDTPGEPVETVPNWLPTHLYYFATPPIFVGTRHFSNALFEKFCRYYVSGFMNTVKRFRGANPLRVFYPSTVAITTPPPDMGEYVAAKAAGEAICRQLSILYPDVLVDVDRLPRLPTDQTATLFPVETADPIPLLLDILAKG